MSQLEKKEQAAIRTILAVHNIFASRLCVTTSFQKSGIVLLDLIFRRARVKIPVVTVDTRFLFDETKAFASDLVKRWGFMLIVEQAPKAAKESPYTDACCMRQKVEPFRKALKPYSAWLTAIRKDQTTKRANLEQLTLTSDGKVKVAPLLDWTAEDIDEQTKSRKLPVHPLYEKGYASIGCWPCTTPILEGEDDRAGRWRGCGKEECGIHE